MNQPPLSWVKLEARGIFPDCAGSLLRECPESPYQLHESGFEFSRDTRTFQLVSDFPKGNLSMNCCWICVFKRGRRVLTSDSAILLTSFLWRGRYFNHPLFVSVCNISAKGTFWGLNIRILYLLEMMLNNLLTLSLFHLDNMKLPISINVTPCVEMKGSRGNLHISYIPSKSKVFLF